MIGQLLLLFWLIAIVGPLVLKALEYSFPQLSPLLSWGKTGQKSRFSIAHKHFTIFYVTGFFFNGIILLALYRQDFRHMLNLTLTSLYPACFIRESSAVLPNALLQIQLGRRILESVFVTKHSNSTMHITHFLFGLVYYIAVSLSLLTASSPVDQQTANLAVILFSWASYHQFKCHTILAGLRGGDQVYGVPYGDWFEYVSSPHYSAEIIIYIAILITTDMNVFMLLNCVYQVSNFSVVCAMPTHRWYQRKFKDYPEDRYALIPYLI